MISARFSMSDPLSALPCCLEVPSSFAAKVRYALRMLLLPLGFDPRWVGREALAGTGLYYGPEAEGLPAGAMPLPFDAEATSYFERRTPLDPGRVQWIAWDEALWPLLFGTPARPDLVASAFFWLSGWQEHVTRVRDEHGRFPFRASLQAALGTATRPAVDAYRALLAEGLQAQGLSVRRRRWSGHRWALCPTHDIDYVRKWRPGIIYREGVQHLFLNRAGRPLGERLQRLRRNLVQAARREDVYLQATKRMRAAAQQRGGRATYFFKAGAHSPHDVGYRLERRSLREEAARLLAAGFEVGLHPSYHAHTHAGYLEAERDRLAAWAGERPVSVRQHYLRYETPQTPRLHVQAGFRLDSTLGFAAVEGFRHATCLPFQLYDIERDAPLPLWEMPLALMESALFNRRGLSADEALQTTADLMATCRRFGGVAVLLWHNVLWDEIDFPGWGQHFTDTLDRAQAEGALITSLRDAFDGWYGSTDAAAGT